MDPSTSKELVYSMLDAAGSMQMLTDELDRLSLHSLPATDDTNSASQPHRSYKDHDPHWLADWPTELVFQGDNTSEVSMGDNESPKNSGRSRTRRISRTSSNYDSAIGSLQSRTDEETNSLHSSVSYVGRRNTPQSSKKVVRHAERRLYTHSDKEWLYHTQHGQHIGSYTTSHIHHSPKEHHDGKQRNNRSLKHHTESSASGSVTSTPSRTTCTDDYQRRHQESFASVNSPVTDFLKREGSTRSTSSTGSYSSKRSSQVLSVGLSEEDILEMSKLTIDSQKSTRKKNSSTAVIRSDFHIAPEKQHAEVVYVHHDSTQTELQDSDSSNSTVIDERNTTSPIKLQQAVPQKERPNYVASVNTSMSVEEGPLTPDIVVISTSVDTTTKKKVKRGKVHRVEIQNGTTFHQDTLDPKSSPLISSRKVQESKHRLNPHPRIPQRYRDSSLENLRPGLKKIHPQASNVPKRSASFLQRLKIRRGTSFKSERKPKKRVPVRRSFSDRIMYQIQKGWVDYKGNLDFISNPSRLRPIGRMVDRQAGRLHIVQLHRPPSGRYGLFISQSVQRSGVFISRFADSNAAKFYSGLIEPGDEIVKINKEYVRDKSVDYVYNLMAKLDSVIFTVLPVNSRPDW